MPFALGMIGGVGIPELVLIVLMVVLFFGAARIPLIARGLGEGIRNFKGGLKERPQIERDDAQSEADRDAGGEGR